MDQVTSHRSPIYIEDASITFEESLHHLKTQKLIKIKAFISLHFQTLLGHILQKKNNKAKLLMDGVQAWFIEFLHCSKIFY